MALTLADYETPLWLDRVLAGAESVAAFLRFHTGARLVSEPAEASFALISDVANAPPLSAFAQGTPDYPDRSTTLIIEVERFSAEGWRLQGPGIAGETAFGAAPLAADFGAQLVANRAQFPLGVDVIFAAPLAVAALPRSVQLVEAC
jgi:alpha-D-ribose 1-methylphosphonate 5-triphosphate synthase subunit PhnH